MNKKNASIVTIIILLLGFIANFLFQIMPDKFKKIITSFSNIIGLTYTQFWIICTLLIIATTMIFVWIKAKGSKNRDKKPAEKREINIEAKKSNYFEKPKGDIRIDM